MKRWAILLIVVGLAGSALAFDPRPRGNRIGVLDLSASYDSTDAHVATVIERYLCEDLRSRGFDAFQSRTPHERLVPFDPANADYYVEIAGSREAARPIGDIAVGNGNVSADLGVIVSHVAAHVRLYDGRTLELLRTLDLHKHNTTVVPTGIGIGGWSGRLAFWAALPLFQWRQAQSAARGVARDAASSIAEEVQH